MPSRQTTSRHPCQQSNKTKLTIKSTNSFVISNPGKREQWAGLAAATAGTLAATPGSRARRRPTTTATPDPLPRNWTSGLYEMIISFGSEIQIHIIRPRLGEHIQFIIPLSPQLNISRGIISGGRRGLGHAEYDRRRATEGAAHDRCE